MPINTIIHSLKNQESTLQKTLHIYPDLKDQILDEISALCGFEVINLNEQNILNHFPQNIEISFYEKFEFVIFDVDSKHIKIALLEPLNTARLKIIQDKIKTEFNNIKQEFYIAKSGFDEVKNYLKDLSILNDLTQKMRSQKMPDTKDIQENLSIIQMLEFLFEIAIKNDSSDIHLESFETKALMRLRIDGILCDKFEIHNDIFKPLSSRLKLDCNLDIHELRKPQDGRFSKIFNGREFDFRLSFMPSINGESIVIRILDKNISAKSLEELGFEGVILNHIKSSIYAPNGMVFITGPTGSGKSTTLYSMLESIKNKNANTKKIITIEDPVEYYIDGVTQVLVHEKYGFDFAMALRSILRQDPDIIMVGEVRDTPTLEVALRASLTGHLVLSTLHANDSISAIDRLLDMGVERYLVSGSLNGIISQRLLRRLCGCAQGCLKCGFSKYRGRILISECVKMDEKLDLLIKNGENKNTILDYLKNNDFVSIMDNALNAVNMGYTNLEEVYRVCK